LYRTAPLLALIGLALTLASCGGGGSSTTQTEKVVVHEATPKKVKVVATKSPGCQGRLGDLVDRMDDLRQALLAGLSYSEYVVRVQAVRAAYEAVPVDKLALPCLSGPAADAEDAFNQYLRAANLWGECAGTKGCAASSIEGRLQDRWRTASKSLEAAKKPS
jgi:hypothetical protein